MARERRRKHINGYWSTVESGDGAELSRLFVPCETDSGILSVINEHASDAGSAKLASSCASVDLPATESRADGELPEPQLSETASDFSRETSPEGSNISATTVGELVRPDETAQDISEDEDTMSVVTDHTDLSLIEEFDASPTPFDPILLLVLISLKEEAVDHITRRLQTMMLQSAGTQRPVQDNNPGSSSSQPPSGDAGKSSLAATLTTGRKRALDEDEGGNPGRGDGDDGEKRKRIESTSKTRPEEPLKRFACPFYKRYPESEKLQKSCRGPGWPDVHRTKEHIYRRHKSQTFPCNRCFVPFLNEAALSKHQRAETPCEIKDPSLDAEIIYITQSQEKELRQRQKGDIGVEDRWLNCFRIIFPDVSPDQLPTPYHESYQDPPPDSAILRVFRAFVEQHLPSRIEAGVNNHLLARRLLPVGFSIDGMTEVIRAAVWEVMEEYPVILASSPPDRAASGHVGSTAADWPFRETTASVGGPYNSLTNTRTIQMPPALAPAPLPTSRSAGRSANSLTNTHTIPAAPALVPAPFPTSWSAGRPSSTLPSGPSTLSNTHPIPSPLWNVTTVFDSPISSALDLPLLHNTQPLGYQQPGTDSAPPAQALGSPSTALPGSWSNPTPNNYDSFEPFLTSTDIEAFLQFDDNGARA